MREFVGVISGLEVITNERTLRLQNKPLKPRPHLFKKEALMFSRVAVYDLKEMLPRLRMFENESNDVIVSEVERLVEEKVVFEPSAIPENGQINNTDFENLNLIRKFFENEARSAFERLDVESLVNRVKTDPSSYEEVVKETLRTVPPMLYYSQYEARCVSVYLQELESMDAYPVLSNTFTLPQLFNLPSIKKDIVNITLNSLPVPDDSVPWEQILEYRSDPDSQSKFLALRHWMSEVARAELTPAEVEEKLAYLVDQYQRHMKLHRMKTNIGTLETIVTTGAEVLGDLASFKWGKAAEALFSLKRRKVALLEGELTAPGNEVAYIVKARESFGSQ